MSVTEAGGTSGRRDAYDLQSTSAHVQKGWSGFGFEVTEITKSSSMKEKMTAFFKNFASIRIKADDGTYLFLKPDSDLSRELLSVYKKGGKKALDNAVKLLEPKLNNYRSKGCLRDP